MNDLLQTTLITVAELSILSLISGKSSPQAGAIDKAE
jgi:hypothetical protein